MRVRFIGPEPHEVAIAGREFGTVSPGDVLDVPDELVRPREGWPGVEFPPSLWEDVKAETKKKGDS